MGGRYIETHEETVARLTAELAAKKAKIEDYRAEIAATEAETAAIEAEKAAIEAKIEDYRTELAAIEKAAWAEVWTGVAKLSDQQKASLFYAIEHFGDAFLRAIHTHMVLERFES